jgi:hypothetical protein
MFYNESELIPERYYILDDDNNLVISGDGWETEDEADEAARKELEESPEMSSLWVMYCEMQNQPELVICHALTAS